MLRRCVKFLEASRINRNRFSINRWRYLTSTLIRPIPIRIHCASKGWPTEFGQIDATCHSLNATPFARSKGGGKGGGMVHGRYERRKCWLVVHIYRDVISLEYSSKEEKNGRTKDRWTCVFFFFFFLRMFYLWVILSSPRII